MINDKLSYVTSALAVRCRRHWEHCRRLYFGAMLNITKYIIMPL